jgi:hypothetical protein
MRLLEYNELDFRSIKADYLKVRELLLAGDYKTSDLKKLKGSAYFRVKLNYADRLLLALTQYQGVKHFIALEIIHNHDYSKSKFLRGASVQEDQVLIDQLPPEEIPSLKYVHPSRNTVHFIKRFISFDDKQEEVYTTYPPVIISGPAGSGKTILLLEKMKQLSGNGLYVTQSNYLVDHARQIYSSHSSLDEHQEIDFLSFKHLLETIHIPTGKEIDSSSFARFISLHRGNPHFSSISKEVQKIFEEFKGVITSHGIERPWLTREEYVNLGVKQTIYLGQDRERIYDLFEKYLVFLKDDNRYDLNILSWNYLGLVRPTYDFVVVDEIQDLTPVQISFILSFLKKPENFIFCGDGHQIVHPNFFSWSKLKTFLFDLEAKNKIRLKQQILQVITTNFRNAKKITELSNKILVIKNLKFGALDKESHFLLETNADNEGSVDFFEEKPKLCDDLNKKTKKSVRWAVIVMSEELKSLAKKQFQTPLIFTIHEAKGLEYENVILYNFISAFDKSFRQISEEISPAQVLEVIQSGQHQTYARNRDKEDKTLEALKFYINSAYVAVTRAVEKVIWIENLRKHPFFDLIQAESIDAEAVSSLKEDQSSLEDWQIEATKLANQGKLEQAQAIKDEILKIENVPWKVMDTDRFFKLQKEALDPKSFNKKEKQKLYEFAHTYWQPTLFKKLAEAKHTRAQNPDKDTRYVHNVYNEVYASHKFNDLKRDVSKYGPNFKDEMGRPVLMGVALSGNSLGVKYLLERGADPHATDLFGANTLQRLLVRNQLKCFMSIHTDELIKIYDLLAQYPLKVRYKNRAIVVMPKKAEFFLVNYFIGLFTYLYSKGENYITAQMLEFHFTPLPPTLLPEWRRPRKYWNSILAKNHCEKIDAPGNLFLLRRIQTGVYILNPDLEFEVGGEWIKIYPLLRTTFLDVLASKMNFLPRYLDILDQSKEKMASSNQSDV